MADSNVNEVIAWLTEFVSEFNFTARDSIRAWAGTLSGSSPTVSSAIDAAAQGGGGRVAGEL